MLDSHPGYHPRPKQGGVALPSKEGTDPTAKVAKLYDHQRKVEVVSYNVERLAKDCVSVFCELSGYPKANVGTAPTPFLVVSKDPIVRFEEPPRLGIRARRISAPRALCPRKRGRLPTRGKDLVSCQQSRASA